MSARVVSRDRGAKAIVKELTELAAQGRTATTLKVGILSKGADAAHDGSLTVADVAEIQEFGAEWTDKSGAEHKIPARSFIRGWVDSADAQIKEAFRVIMGRVARREISREQALGQLGSLFVAQIQQRIVNHIPPPNAQSTIDAKGSSTPLVDEGQLKASITFEVE